MPRTEAVCLSVAFSWVSTTCRGAPRQFTSRPKRSVGHMVTPDMADIWCTGSFAKDPPNATVSVFHKDGGNVSDLVVTLKTARLEGEKLTFDVDVLEGSLGAADGPASVFIDN